MGKTTGFLDYARMDCPTRPPLVRLGDFAPFHEALPLPLRREQGGRCMDCGVPFCQAGLAFKERLLGCPLHNLIPEWNDLLWRDNWDYALARLLKTNCFPEFTSRVCPAPCEGACACGLTGQSVTIRDNEGAIIDYAFQQGWMTPQPPQRRSGLTVAVVGSGPAGLAAAYYLNHRGHTVTVLEQDDAPGGLLTYGIPAMKLDKALVKRRVALLEAEGITFQCGTTVGRDISPKELDQTYDAVLFACGARKPRPVPYEGDAGGGLCYGLDYLIQTQRHLDAGTPSPLSAKDKRLAIIGAGDTASDCVATALRQGCKSLTQLIRKPAAYYPPELDDAHVESQAKFGRDIRRFETTIHALACGKDGKLRQAVLNTPQGEKTLPVDLVIVASGFSGCEDASLQVRDAMPRPEKVFSAGDMVLGASLVVLAIASGKQAAAQADTYLMGCTNIL